MGSERWWETGIIYQIYPRSFQDSDGDGVGDLRGIMQRLDYLAWLGVDAIWLSPVFRSPMVDFGYDVSDYTNIDPLFGTLDDLDALLAAVHERQLKLILDFVPNHTSDQHPWFLDSRSSRTNPKRDWYLWRDSNADGTPPNNWLSEFGGSAWTWDELSGQYYLHSFASEQPDLNWRNPDVIEAMSGVLRFWLDRGVDGFRMDVIHQLLKDAQWRDDPPNPHYVAGRDLPQDSLLRVHSSYQPDVHELIRAFRRVLDGYDNRVFIGEIHYAAPLEHMCAFYGSDDQCHLPFNFWLVLLPWEAATIRNFVESYSAGLPDSACPNYVTGNHDCSRIASRIGSAQARVAAMLLLTLRGTPFIYYGEELGMTDGVISAVDTVDVRGINVPGFSRDPSRTPMQWDGTSNAGFTTGKPWLPIAPDAARVNVAGQREQPGSMLSLFRAIIAYRQAHPALHRGRQTLLADMPDDCFAYIREHNHQRILVALNFSGQACMLSLPDDERGQIMISTHLDRMEAIERATLHLRGHEGCIVELD